MQYSKVMLLPGIKPLLKLFAFPAPSPNREPILVCRSGIALPVPRNPPASLGTFTPQGRLQSNAFRCGRKVSELRLE